MAWNPKHGKPLVCVYWNDAHGSATQVYSDQEHKPYPMETYGLLLKDDETGVSICSETYFDNIDTKQEFRGHTFIPRGMVINLEILLKPHGPRKPRKSRTVASQSHEGTPEH